MDELGRWPRRGPEVDVDGGGASRLEAWWMAARDWGGGRNWLWFELVEPALVGMAWATFLKTIVHFNSSPEKRVVPSSSKRTNTRMLPESGDMMELLQKMKEWQEKPHETGLHIAVVEGVGSLQMVRNGELQVVFTGLTGEVIASAKECRLQ